MLYMKNVPNWERVVRVLVSIAFAVIGIQQFGLGLYGILIAASAAGFALTGFVGWCPMCAMVGRRLDKNVASKNLGNV